MQKEDFLILIKNSFESSKGINLDEEFNENQKRKIWFSNEVLNNDFCDLGVDLFYADFALINLKQLNQNNLCIFPEENKESLDLYRNRLLVLQNPFFMENIGCGTSIRGAYWDYKNSFKIVLNNAIKTYPNRSIIHKDYIKTVDRGLWILYTKTLEEFLTES